jgi:hypothetical protein
MKFSVNLGRKGKLGTNWSVPSLGVFFPYIAKTYKTGHQNPGETQASRDFDYVKTLPAQGSQKKLNPRKVPNGH